METSNEMDNGNGMDVNVVEIVIDNREASLIELIKTAKVKQLHLGDIQFMYHGNVVCIIERKTMSDLLSSIKDGRAREQKAR